MHIGNILFQCFLFIMLLFCAHELYQYFDKDNAQLTFSSSAYFLCIYNVTIIIFFAFIYYFLGIFSKTNHFIMGNKPTKLSMFQAVYSSTVTQTTVGHGHVIPKTFTAKCINLIQMFSILINITLLPIVHNTIILKNNSKI